MYDTSKRLAIVIPYRDRAEHLARALPHLSAYFAREKVDRAIKTRVYVIEQADGYKFNQGALTNFGINLAAPECDYLASHDVDQLPVWADYSYTDRPVRIVYQSSKVGENGAWETDRKPDYRRFFGYAVLAPNEAWRAVNGYSNAYWGWCFNDQDLWARCQIEGIPTGHRDGSFIGLPHVDQGFSAPNILRPDAVKQLDAYRERTVFYRSLRLHRQDGLSTLECNVVTQEERPIEGLSAPFAFETYTHVKLDLTPEWRKAQAARPADA